jgi:streptogramin lyase
MTKPPLLNLIGILIIVCVFTHPGYCQTKTSPKPIPVIIGTPPPAVGEPSPINDRSLVTQYVRAIFQDSRGNYWFGPIGQGAAIRYDIRTLHYYSINEFYYGNADVGPGYSSSIHAIAEDKQGNIWFGTDRGVVRYDPRLPDGQGKSFKSYTKQQGLSDTQVGRKCILVDRTGTIWVGTRGGVFQYDPEGDGFSLFHLTGSIKVKDMMEDRAGNIWFATEDKGVFYYDWKTIKNITAKEGLGDNYAGGMAQDPTGNLWFLTRNGICLYDDKSFTEITAKDGLGGTEFWGIYIEKSGIIWVTARGATTRYDPSIPITNPKAFTVFTPEDGLNCCVQSMYQDRLGNMWWGTGQGLYRFDGNRFYQVKQNGPW